MNQQKWPSLFMNILEYRISRNRIDLLAKKRKATYDKLSLSTYNEHQTRVLNSSFSNGSAKKHDDIQEPSIFNWKSTKSHSIDQF